MKFLGFWSHIDLQSRHVVSRIAWKTIVIFGFATTQFWSRGALRRRSTFCYIQRAPPLRDRIGARQVRRAHSLERVDPIPAPLSACAMDLALKVTSQVRYRSSAVSAIPFTIVLMGSHRFCRARLEKADQVNQRRAAGVRYPPRAWDGTEESLEDHRSRSGR